MLQVVAADCSTYPLAVNALDLSPSMLLPAGTTFNSKHLIMLFHLSYCTLTLFFYVAFMVSPLPIMIVSALELTPALPRWSIQDPVRGIVELWCEFFSNLPNSIYVNSHCLHSAYSNSISTAPWTTLAIGWYRKIKYDCSTASLLITMHVFYNINYVLAI